jgi:steroid delta-isomerase-like uncharacterized protein
MSTGNKALVKRFYNEVVNQGNLDLAGELMDHDYIEHGNPAASGLEGFKQFVANLAVAFPDLQITIEDLISEGDKVVARVTVRATHLGAFMGYIPPSGVEVTFTGIDIFQIKDDKIVGRWNHRDLLGLMQQIGAVRL